MMGDSSKGVPWSWCNEDQRVIKEKERFLKRNEWIDGVLTVEFSFSVLV